MFKLHPQLQQDCLFIGRFELCCLLLMRDANYPWFILVPEREGISEIHQLSQDVQYLLIRESSYLSEKLMAAFRGDKMNVAALGNMVPQLHIHHVVRYRDDAAWPAPIWGQVPAKPYTEEGQDAVIEKLRAVLTEGFEFSV